jgi:ABC-type multidrug transport system fused ATPase/permease subunit
VEEYQQLIGVISLTMGVAWASGLNLYAAILVLGFAGSTGGMELPENLQIVQDPAVMLAAGLMYAVEFFADKVPGVDTGWDAIHTFIRIPAGALLAASTVGDVSPALQLAAGIVGGSVTSVTHAAKASTRVLINTSPEPVSNWLASISEDVAVFGGLWVALNHPTLFLIGFIAFLFLLIWLLPKLWRGIARIFRKVGQWLGLGKETREAIEDPSAPSSSPLSPAYTAANSAIRKPLVEALQGLEVMHKSGALSDAEFEQAKASVIAEYQLV